MIRTRFAFACSALTFVLTAAGACSDSGDDPGGGSGSSGAAGNGGSAAAGGGGSGGSVSTGGTGAATTGGSSGSGGGNGGSAFGGSSGTFADGSIPDVEFQYDASETDGFAPDSQCAATVVTAQLTPLDMYMMVDKSTSMLGLGSGPCTSSSGQTCWTDVKTAIKAFVADPSTSGIGVGIQYFPVLPQQYTSTCTSNNQCGNYGPCTNSFCRACNVTHYSTPAVPIGILPAQANSISASIDSITPFGGTPTGPALQGAVNYTTSWAQTHPGHKVVIVLATDGTPTDCSPTDINQISAIVSGALTGPQKILTFVIGVGKQLTNLNAIANAGGSQQAYLVDTGGNIQQQFIQAMKDIQKKTIGCEYQMPKPATGIVDPNKVQLELQPSSGPSKLVNKVSSAAQCGTGDGFYYDNNTSPTKIYLCPKTCTTVQSDPGSVVNISLGCLGS